MDESDAKVIAAAEEFAREWADYEPIDPDGELTGEMLRRLIELAKRHVPSEK